MESTLTIKKYFKVDDRRKNILNWDIMGVQYGWKREEKIEVTNIVTLEFCVVYALYEADSNATIF